MKYPSNINTMMDIVHTSDNCTNFQCMFCVSKPTYFEMQMKIKYLKIQTEIYGNAVVQPTFNLVYDFCDESIMIYTNHISTNTIHGLHVLFKPNLMVDTISMYDTGNIVWKLVNC